MRELRRTDVLLNEETSEIFNREDVVKIIKWICNKEVEYIGRIEYIETSELTLDMSTTYKSHFMKIRYEDISKIELFK
jgi:hypothetical protein